MSYNPRNVPSTLEQIPPFLQEELRQIAINLVRDPSYTQEQLRDSKSSVNTKFKGAGVRVWDATNKRPVWSTGNSPTDFWVNGDGGIAHTPI